MKSLPVRLSGALGIAALSLSFTFGGSYVVRAENPEALPPSLQDMVVTPIMRAVEGLEQRIASLEASVADFAASFTSRHITTHELCVSDESGAQTCITKAQLDALLRGMAHADVSQPSLAVSDANAPPAAEAVETVAAPETAAAPETIAAPEIAEPATGAVADENAQEDQDPAQTGTIPAAFPAPTSAADESSRDDQPAPQTETATPASATEASVPDESSQDDQQPAQIETVTSVSAAATSVSDVSSQEDQQQAQAEPVTVTSSAPAPIPAPDAEISTPAPAPANE